MAGGYGLTFVVGLPFDGPLTAELVAMQARVAASDHDAAAAAPLWRWLGPDHLHATLAAARRTRPAPLTRADLPADLETPVSVYLKLRGRGPSFLLESITGGEQVARTAEDGVQVLADGAGHDLLGHVGPRPVHGGERPVGVGSEVWAYEPVVTADPKS